VIGKSVPKGAASGVLKNHYPGGFESTMSRGEAALILGVRRTASIKKIKEKHRKLMVANHPDAGGSPLVATKINQAKDLLLKDMEPTVEDRQ
jgi:DnaJ family protein C protein 19